MRRSTSVMPSELFAVARDLLAAGLKPIRPLAAEIRREAAESPRQLNYETDLALLRHAQADAWPIPTLRNCSASGRFRR